MNKTAIKMLALGVAALAVLGGAVAIKNSCAAVSAEGAKVSAETISELNDAARNLAQKAAKAIEEANIKTDTSAEKTAEEGHVGALGVSQSVPAQQNGPSVLPWLIILCGLGGGALLVVTAFMKQYRPVPREERVAAAVDEIIARRTGQRPSRSNRFSRSARHIKSAAHGATHHTQAEQAPHKYNKCSSKSQNHVLRDVCDDDFEDISRAVDEIVAKHQEIKHQTVSVAPATQQAGSDRHQGLQ